MDAAQWERIRELFGTALEMPPDEGAAWLRAACADDEERREVLSLLSLHRQASGFLDKPVFGWRPPEEGFLLNERYELRAEIGQGGMATVYEAWDGRLERRVAVKLTFPGLFTPDALLRFEREARIVARLDHPSIVPVYDYGTAPDLGTAFLVMPLFRGDTLRARIGSLTTEEAVALTVQLARALDYSHAQGVVHRDVKPENVLVVDGPGGPEARLTDFGLALEDAGTRLTRTGAVFGTVTYMSPEQVSGREVGPGGDLYSLGTVLYECLAGFPPFSGPAPSLLYQIVHETPPPLDESKVEPALAELVLACLAKDPRERPASGNALAADLERRPAESETPSTRPRWPALAATLLLLVPLWVLSSLQPSLQQEEEPLATPVAPRPASLSEAAWERAGDLQQGRWMHSATLLENGMVLVAGGSIEGHVASTEAEVFDPRRNAWLPPSVMSQARSRHTATRLRDGRVLVAGGAGYGGMLKTAEIYDPAAGTWTLTAPMSVQHQRHTATLLHDGRVLVAGGERPGHGVAEIWDPATETWTRAADLNVPRGLHVALLLNDGRVLTAGGGTGGRRESVEIYDPESDRWTLAAPMATPRFLFTATLLRDGRVLVAGGVDNDDRSVRTAEVYDPRRDAWETVGEMSEPWRGPEAVHPRPFCSTAGSWSPGEPTAAPRSQASRFSIPPAFCGPPARRCATHERHIRPAFSPTAGSWSPGEPTASAWQAPRSTIPTRAPEGAGERWLRWHCRASSTPRRSSRTAECSWPAAGPAPTPGPRSSTRFSNAGP